jgi:hypothetical protein
MGPTGNIARSFSYAEFRAATELSKKEADGWVQAGVIQAGPAAGHRREYWFESIFEGIIAKQLADFSSRELLPRTMAELRAFLVRENMSMAKLLSDPSRPHRLLKIYTRKSRELMPGGGVRGVVTYIDWYEPRSPKVAKSVYLVVDLTLVALETQSAIAHLSTS